MKLSHQKLIWNSVHMAFSTFQHPLIPFNSGFSVQFQTSFSLHARHTNFILLLFLPRTSLLLNPAPFLLLSSFHFLACSNHGFGPLNSATHTGPSTSLTPIIGVTWRVGGICLPHILFTKESFSFGYWVEDRQIKKLGQGCGKGVYVY